MYFDFNDKDVLKTIHTVLSEMDKIRDDVIKDRKMSYVMNDDYLHLTYELASMVNNVALKHEGLRNTINKINHEIEQDEILLTYDPLQDECWVEEKNDFIKFVNMFTLFFTHDINNINNGKHHLFQALKYISSRGLENEERLHYIDSIKPFIGGLRKSTKEYCYNLEDFLMGVDSNKGYFYLNFYLNPFTALFNHDNYDDPIEEASSFAKKHGFVQVKIVTRKKIDRKIAELERSVCYDNKAYIFKYKEEIKPSLLQAMMNMYERYGKTVSYILTEPVYEEKKIPEKEDKDKELSKIKLFDAEEEFFDEHNAEYDLPILLTGKQSSMVKNLFISESKMLLFLTTPDSKQPPDKLKEGLNHLLSKNNKPISMQKELVKIFKDNILFSRLYGITDKGLELLDENIYLSV